MDSTNNLPKTEQSHWITDIEGSALLDYASCPQKYAYRWQYNVPEKPTTPRAILDRAIFRACLVVARQKLETATPSVKQTEQIWRLHAAGTPISGHSKNNLRGRTCVLQFLTWLRNFEPVAIALKTVVPIKISEHETYNVKLQADLTGTYKSRRCSVVLARKVPELMAFMATNDQLPWVSYHLEHGTTRDLPAGDIHAYAPLLQQLQRGLARRIIWSNRDERCNSCPWSDICDPRHSSKRYINDPLSRQRMRKTILAERK